MAEAVLITGGNLGNVAGAISRCNAMISERVGRIVKLSSMVESDAWGFCASEKFLNQVLVIETDLSPIQILEQTQQIEREMGRQSKSRRADGTPVYASRTMDIDILFYDNRVIDTPELTIPHPLLHEREFVLTPLCEVESERIHPILAVSMNELKNRLNK